MNDQVVLAALLVTFALAVTMHLAIVAGLLRRPPRWRAPVALLVPPLAPYWALRDRMRVRAVVWVGAVVGYGVCFFLSGR